MDYDFCKPYGTLWPVWRNGRRTGLKILSDKNSVNPIGTVWLICFVFKGLNIFFVGKFHFPTGLSGGLKYL